MLSRYKLFSLMILFMSALVLSGCENYAERTHESWVTPEPGAVFDDSTIYARITYAIQSDADLQGADIELKVDNGDILLTGTVLNRDQITRVNMHSWTADGVKNVDNQLAVR